MKKKFILSLLVIILALGVGTYFYFDYVEKEEKLELDKLEKEELVELISSKNKEIVLITNDTDIYNGEGEVIGKLYKDETVYLDVLDSVNENTKYLKLKDYEYYISYVDTEEYLDVKLVDDSYLSYIPFNENIVSESVTFYRGDKLVMEITDSINLPVYRKNATYYYVIYNGELLNVKTDSVSLVTNTNQTEGIASSVPVLNYHFFYDDADDINLCNQIICHHTDNFIDDLNYLRDNGYYATTMDELYLFVMGEINLPANSVSITIDDGWLAHKGIALLNEYQFNHTLFSITAHYPKELYPVSDYLEVHVHTDNLHDPYVCPGYGLQGSALYCSDYDVIYNDLMLSRSKLDNSDVFCFPFYEYSDYSLGILKDAGFKMAFIGGNKDVVPGMNPFLLPRHVVLSTSKVRYMID